MLDFSREFVRRLEIAVEFESLPSDFALEERSGRHIELRTKVPQADKVDDERLLAVALKSAQEWLKTVQPKAKRARPPRRRDWKAIYQKRRQWHLEYYHRVGKLKRRERQMRSKMQRAASR